MRSSVDFPAPLGPISPTRSPARRSSDRPVNSVVERPNPNGSVDPAAARQAVGPTSAPAETASPTRRSLRSLAAGLGPRRLSAVYLAALFFAIFSAIDPSTYPTSETMRLVLQQNVPKEIHADLVRTALEEAKASGIF